MHPPASRGTQFPLTGSQQIRSREFTGSVAMVKMMLISFLVTIICLAIGGGGRVVAGYRHHHVVGDDRGWDPTTKLSGWSSGQTFRVGDKIWFAYSVVAESIFELGSKEEYELCDVSNPIRMFTNGLNSVSLEEEGARYFVSGKAESCKNGLKLHVVVQPEQSVKNQEMETDISESSAVMMLAEGPTPSPSSNHASSHIALVLMLSLLASYYCSA